MKEPLRDIIGRSAALEEIMRHERKLQELVRPSVTSRMIEAVEQASTRASVIEGLTRHSKILEFTQTPAYLRAIEAATATLGAAEISRSIQLANLIAPKLPELLRLSESVAARVRPFEDIVKQAQWSSILSDRMANIGVNWALSEEIEGSVEAFARLSRLSDVARLGTAYTDTTTEILVEELGQPSEAPAEEENIEQREARYDEAGRDRELIAFPPASYSQILISAGYAVSFPSPPTVVVEEGLIEPVRFSPQTGFLIQSLEAHLRQLVVDYLSAREGDNWMKRRVPQKVQENWRSGREAAKLAGKPVLAPIYYANFMDLADIITSGNNWPEFQAAFKNKDNLRISLQRLYFIRNDIAHARPISMTDELLAMTEGTILFRAMGLPVKYNT